MGALGLLPKAATAVLVSERIADVLVEGFIDLPFEADDNLVMEDYKTDRLESMSEVLLAFLHQARGVLSGHRAACGARQAVLCGGNRRSRGRRFRASSMGRGT